MEIENGTKALANRTRTTEEDQRRIQQMTDPRNPGRFFPISKKSGDRRMPSVLEARYNA